MSQGDATALVGSVVSAKKPVRVGPLYVLKVDELGYTNSKSSFRGVGDQDPPLHKYPSENVQSPVIPSPAPGAAPSGQQ